MECGDLPQITCRLERIARELERFDFETFLASVAATLIGALLAGLVAWLVFRGESRERYADRLTDAVESLATAMTKTAKDFVAWQDAMIKFYGLPEEEQTEQTRPAEPDRIALDVGLDMLIARARGEDRVTALQIREVAYQLTFILDGKWARIEYATLRRVLVAWRAGRRTQAQTRLSLATIDKRRQLAATMRYVDDAKLPPAPEKHESPSIG